MARQPGAKRKRSQEVEGATINAEEDRSQSKLQFFFFRPGTLNLSSVKIYPLASQPGATKDKENNLGIFQGVNRRVRGRQQLL